MNVGIIGCGSIGKKRALALSPDDSIVGCYDVDDHVRESFARQFRCRTYADSLSLLQDDSCEAVVVAVVNKFTKDLAIEALEHSKHVLVEKPLGRNVAEAKEIMDRWRQEGKATTLKVGFNHRFHPAIWRAKELMDEGLIGRLITIRARYGHGGRPGMEGEWRASKDLCGGGELLDQGVHIVDLIRWFGGEIQQAFGLIDTSVWKTEVEDNAFGLLKTERGVNALFHVSWTNWRNIFSFEIFGDKGYLNIDGLGGNYGVESLEVGRRKPEGGRPTIERLTYSENDTSWMLEWEEFRSAIQDRRQPVGNGEDGLKANVAIEAIYESARLNVPVRLP